MVDFESMNETDVREIIVRPLLEQLGYRHGTDANIRTEQTLKYAHAFLGRKNPKKDPALTGRADYTCDVISFGRWAVEVKAPGEKLTADVIAQAHTYAAHPEIAASHFLITNGREFRLYRAGALESLELRFYYENLQQNVLKLFNLVGPEAVRKRARMAAVDPGNPLGPGISSRVEIVGGEVRYDAHSNGNPLFDPATIDGLILPVTGGFVERAEDGRIHAYVQVAKAAAMFRDLSDLLHVDGYDFYSATEYISIDPQAPTIFQNFLEMHTKAGTPITVPPLGKVPIPFSMDMLTWTEAVGFVQNDTFLGTMHLSYDITVSGMTPQIRSFIEAQAGRQIPNRSQIEGTGTFAVKLRSAV